MPGLLAAARRHRRLLTVAVVLLAVAAIGIWLYRTYEPHVDLAWVLDKFERYGYFVIFVPVFLETAGLPLPGETTLLFTGVAASRGRIDVFEAIAVATVAATLGDNLGYAIGRFGGRRLVLRLAHIGHLQAALARGEMYFERHGGKTVFFARWLPGLRIFGAWIAGMVHMPWRRFALWNLAGAFAWSTSVIGLGYFFGRSLDVIEKALGIGGVIILCAVAVVGFVLYRRHERHALND